MMDTNNDVSFSFAGCGFLGMYHIGVATCLRQHVPHLLKDARFAGASAGALTACGLLCNLPLSPSVDFTLQMAGLCGQLPLGGWEPDMDITSILREQCETFLPENAHEMCTDRLFLSVTTLPRCQNKMISKFNTRQDLIDALVCSCFVPGFSSYYVPKFQGESLIDGALSNNLPKLDDNTITVCPFAGEHSICPRDDHGQTFPLTFRNFNMCPTADNVMRLKDAFMSATHEKLRQYCNDGFNDALRFLYEHDLIHCVQHRTCDGVNEMTGARAERGCTECNKSRHLAHHSCLPEEILSRWDNYEDLNPLEKKWDLTSVVTTPLMAAVKIFLIPITMIRDSLMQLLSKAYFYMKDIGSLMRVSRTLVNSILNPKSFLSQLTLEIVIKAFFSGLEFGVRVCSEVMLTKGVIYDYLTKAGTKRVADRATAEAEPVMDV